MYGNRHVWSQLTSAVTNGSRTDAAIAYVGRSGATLLPLKQGDSIILDGSDRSLKNGTVHPDAVESWLNRGVAVHSLSGLHAKLLVVTGGEGASDRLFVGSANASHSSQLTLAEATLATVDASAVDAARTLLASWTAEAEKVGDRWLTRARRLYKSPPPTPRRRRVELALGRDRLWIGQRVPAYGEIGPDTEEAISQVLDDTSNAIVDWWQMDQADADLMKEGDTLVLVNASENGISSGRAKAGPPGKVMAIVPAHGNFQASAIFVSSDKWPHSTYARVRDTAAAIPWTFEEPITDPRVIDSVLSLFNL